VANRSTFGRDLPRDLGKLVALSKDNVGYTKRQNVVQIESKTKKGDPAVYRLDADGKPKFGFTVLPDYDRMLRGLMMDAHRQHRGFKNARLARELTVDVKEDTRAAQHAADVA
jgi:hypothetical protein